MEALTRQNLNIENSIVLIASISFASSLLLQIAG